MKILWLSDSPTTCTGYATITRNILNGLAEKGHECYCIGHNYLGQDLLPGTTFKDGTKMNFTLIGNGKEQYGKDIIQRKIKEIQPDYFCVLLDTFMLYPWITQMDLSPAKTLFYFPSDGENRLPLECDKVLKKFHIQVAMAKFGQQQCKFVHQLDTEYIPHAVDINNYYKVSNEEKQEIKTKWSLKDKFVIGSVFRNQGRKMPDRMLKAFAEFARDKDDVVLLLHTDPYDNAAPFDMIHYIKELDIENKVRFTGMNFHKGFDYKEMNSIYNVMDTFLLSTCFTPDTPVLTKGGVKNIEDIKVGDKVLSSSKQFRKVQKVLKYKHDGELLKIKTYGLPEIKCTPNHKIYTVKCGDSNKKKKLLKCENPKLELVKANTLNKLDYVVYPIPKTTETKQFISTKKYEKKGRIFSKTGKETTFIHPRSLKLPEKIKLDYDFGLLCGWYLSEGCTSTDGIIFTLGKHERKHQENINRISKKIFNKETKQKDVKSITRITLYSSQLGRIFKDLFNGNCYNKNLPKWILDSPKEFRKGLIEALWKGDGCHWKDKEKYDTFELQTVSKNLMYNVHKLLIAEGFNPSLKFRDKSNKKMIDPVTKKEYDCRDVWTIRITGVQYFGKYINEIETKRKKIKSRIYRDENYIYYPIHNIEKEKYKGDVYDLTVEKEHNYVTNFLVKNSGEGFGVPTIEAMACGVPPVVTDYTTTKELLIENGECGIAVPIETEIIGSWNVSRGCMSISKCAEALNTLYYNKQLRDDMGKVGIEKVNKYYNWNKIINDWDELLLRYKE